VSTRALGIAAYDMDFSLRHPRHMTEIGASPRFVEQRFEELLPESLAPNGISSRSSAQTDPERTEAIGTTDDYRKMVKRIKQCERSLPVMAKSPGGTNASKLTVALRFLASTLYKLPSSVWDSSPMLAALV